jgi:ribosomal protein L30/L7E
MESYNEKRKLHQAILLGDYQPPKIVDKVRKVNDLVVSYKGFYFKVDRTTFFNGGTKDISYHGLCSGMHIHANTKAEIVRKVDRRLAEMLRLYKSHTGFGKRDNPNLKGLLEYNTTEEQH